MKIKELLEYNIGNAETPASSELVEKMRRRGEFLTKFNGTDGYPVKIFKSVDHNNLWFIAEYKDEIIGYIKTDELPTNPQILQVKDAQIYFAYQNQGIGTRMYSALALSAGYRFIHDTQLSPQAEKIWKEKLPGLHLIKGIYDRKRDQVYPQDKTGYSTEDGKIILNPEHDTSDPIEDYDGSGQRFFWIFEGKHPGQAIAAMLEDYARYETHGDDLYFMDSKAYDRARKSPQYLKENIGF